ncbi:MAG: hypothetical protein OFPI_06720 [Osedax symbiont Rs2]|nr:MAG: hypothetical protein OFPI_06720 [Osedax symbiont Rs2]
MFVDWLAEKYFNLLMPRKPIKKINRLQGMNGEMNPEKRLTMTRLA